MRLVILISLTMMAFAANSVLTRLAIDGGHIDPSAFALVRVAAGALVLGMILTLRGGSLPLLRWTRLGGAVSLTVYMIGFTLAYLTLDAGLGALILFGVVQITMFAHAAATGGAPGPRQLTGAAVAFVGLLVALWPGQAGNTSLSGALLMVCAGLGIGIMSDDIAERSGGIVPVLQGEASMPVDMWIVTHRELRQSARIRLVWDALLDALKG